MFEVMTSDGRSLGYINEFMDAEINREINQLYTLDITIPISDPISFEIRQNRLIRYKNEHYLVTRMKDIRDENNRKYKQVECELRVAELLGDVVESFVIVDRTARDALTEALRGNRYGWTVGTVEINTTNSLEEVQFANRWELLVKIQEKWGGEFQYDTETKTISLLNQIGADRGLLVSYSHNMKSIECISDFQEWGTRLYALGRDNLTTERVNGTGEPYIRADTEAIYGAIDYVWKTDIDNANLLYEASLKKLELIKHPRRSYLINVFDLRSIKGYEDYVFNLGDIVKVQDEELGVDIVSRVVSEKEVPGKPEEYSVVVDTTPMNYASLQRQLAEILQRVNRSGDVWDRAKLIDSDVYIEYGKIDYELEEKPRLMFTNRYYSKPVVFLSIHKENEDVQNPTSTITVTSEHVTGLDTNNNITYDGVEVNVIGDVDIVGHTISVWAFCRDPI